MSLRIKVQGARCNRTFKTDVNESPLALWQIIWVLVVTEPVTSQGVEKLFLNS